jgi:protocatechuate 3,4-dioxygenase beta subunit
VTDEHGCCRTPSVVPQSFFTVYVEHEGWLVPVLATPFGERHPQPQTRELKLARLPVVRGLVLDADGGPVPNGLLLVHSIPSADFASDQRWLPSRILFADAGGRFELRGLAPGPYRVMAAGSGSGRSYRTLEVVGGKRNRLLAKLTAGAVVAGRVLDAGGKPLAGAEVTVMSQFMSPVETEFGFVGLSATTGDDGRFTLRGLPEQEAPYYLSASLLGDIGQMAAAEAAAGDTQVVLQVQR